MTPEISIEGAAGWAVLIAPFVLLLTAIAIALAARRRKSAAARKTPTSADRHGQDPQAQPTSVRAAPAGTAAAAPSPAPPPAQAEHEAADGWFPKVIGRAQRRYAAKTEPKFPQPSTARGPDAVRAAAAQAEKSKEQEAEPALLIKLAGRKLSEGDVAEASELLRKSIRLSVSLGRDEDHARARLELGDIARAAGDLTTACEHWQIARRLYQGLSRPAELASAESRMSDHGCPTDWVLNDF